MNIENQPLVTLRISAYNHEQFIEQALLSLVNQTYKNTEIIVIDDGSKDRTPEILNELAGKYNFIFIQQENNGLPSTLNRISSLAKGKYIAGCASDDFLPLDKIEKQVSFLESHNEIAVCGGNVISVNVDGSFRNEKASEDNTFKIIEFEDVFLHDKSIPTGTAMIRIDVLEEVGGFSSEYPVEDKYLWLKITSNGYKIARMNTVLQYYRKHDNNISNNCDFIIDNVKKCLDIYKSHNLYPKAINNFQAQNFNKYAGISRKHSVSAFCKIKWFLLDIESMKQIILGVVKYFNPRVLFGSY